MSLHGKKGLGKKDRKWWHCDKIFVHIKKFAPFRPFTIMNWNFIVELDSKFGSNFMFQSFKHMNVCIYHVCGWRTNIVNFIRVVTLSYEPLLVRKTNLMHSLYRAKMVDMITTQFKLVLKLVWNSTKHLNQKHSRKLKPPKKQQKVIK